MTHQEVTPARPPTGTDQPAGGRSRTSSVADSMAELLRAAAPQVLGTLVQRYGQFDACEDAVQESLLAAAVQWPVEGIPDRPKAWLVTVANRRFIDAVRSEHSRRDREAAVAESEPSDSQLAPGPGEDPVTTAQDDTLTLLFLCCHPTLSTASQIALTLRAVGGLTTAEIAAAFLVPEATMAQRISRAKASIKANGGTFSLPPPDQRDDRLRTVLHVLYLIFNEGYTASSGADLHRTELTTEAIRLTRILTRLLPDDGEITGLLALMLLTDSHRAARMGQGGGLIPLAEQDRRQWNRGEIEEGLGLVSEALTWSQPGPYQLQAAIAAVHAEAASAQDTDWPQIAALYRVLSVLAPNPMVTLNLAAAVGMADGPQAGLQLLTPLLQDDRLARNHRLAAVRGHLLELAGDPAAALDAYREAARLTTGLPEQRYLETQVGRLAADLDRRG